MTAMKSKHTEVTVEGQTLDLYMILNDPEIAKHVCQVDRLFPFIDLEYIGKAKRQSHLDSWKSHHTLSDINKVREAVPDASILVRVNPWHERSKQEVAEAIARGAETIMFPMFHDIGTLTRFYEILNGKAKALPLFETAGSIKCLPAAIRELPIEALHIGLNDLHLDLGLSFMFQCIADGYLEEAAAAMKAAGTRFGIGGISRLGTGTVSADIILGEYYRLGATSTILSRGFHGASTTKAELIANVDFATEVQKLRALFAGFPNMSRAELLKNRSAFNLQVHDIVQKNL